MSYLVMCRDRVTVSRIKLAKLARKSSSIESPQEGEAARYGDDDLTQLGGMQVELLHWLQSLSAHYSHCV
jgi:hypothetical protein